MCVSFPLFQLPVNFQQSLLGFLLFSVEFCGADIVGGGRAVQLLFQRVQFGFQGDALLFQAFQPGFFLSLLRRCLLVFQVLLLLRGRGCGFLRCRVICLPFGYASGFVDGESLYPCPG